MAKLNRICGICRKKYSYCPSCAADANKPTWMTIFCCDNCRDIYNAINDYECKLLSKEEAFSKLSKLDLSCKNDLPKYFKKMLNEILEYEIKTELVMEDIYEKSVCFEKQSEKTEIVKEKEVVEKSESVKVKKRNYNKKTDSIDNIIDNE